MNINPMNLKSWGKIEEACNYYASSRLSNLIEHDIIKEINQKKNSINFITCKKKICISTKNLS